MYQLLEAFERAFTGKIYRHRDSTTGDSIAGYLYEDLHALNQSTKLVKRIRNGEVAVNSGNQIKGKRGRRGDGTFGRVVPGSPLIGTLGWVVPRGLVAHLEIGAEVKIGSTKLIAQVDRVINDLSNQAHVFRGHTTNVIAVGIVGVNYADRYINWEKDRPFTAKTPPSREASDFASRIEQSVGNLYDELLILKFKATNIEPYNLEWLNLAETELLYGSALVRICAEYERRF